MLPFKVQFKPGISAYQQVAYAAKKCVVSGQLRPGDKFPSVRQLSQALKINPNTAHKVVAKLTDEGLLEVRPGIGTVVAAIPNTSSEQRNALLSDSLEQLVVQARWLSLDLDELLGAVSHHWSLLSANATLSARRGKV